jgi:hypothetical protein
LGTGGTLLRIHWEFDGNTLGTKINPTLQNGFSSIELELEGFIKVGNCKT